MKTLTKVLAVITAVVGLVGPAVIPTLSAWIRVHPNLAAVIATVSIILALFHDPKAAS